MDFRPKSRQQKMLDVLYPFLADIAKEYHQEQALRVCRHLRKLGEYVLEEEWIAPFLEQWDAQHPEEEILTTLELQWALENFDENITAQMVELDRLHIANNSTRAKLRIINGGLSENPDIPYVDMTRVVHQYPDF